MEERRLLDDLRIDRSARLPEHPGRRRALLLAIAIVLVGAAGWWMLADTGTPLVEVVTVVEGTPGSAGASVLDASGYVVARRQATVASKITGLLVEVAIDEGVTVEAGQMLARLDDANARRALELAEARLVASRRALEEIEVRLREAGLDLGRIRDLVAEGVASRAALDTARAERDSQAARLGAARAEVAVAEREVAVRHQDLADTVIRAPFNGVAISKDAQPGEIVSPISAGGGFTRTGIGTIVDMRSLEIEVDVNEAFIQRVRPDQPVRATLQAYPDWQIPAHVITTVPAADRQKATVKVRIAFDELGDPRILPDMGIKVSFQADADAATAEPRTASRVPAQAVRREGDAGVVFVVQDNRVERRAVAVGTVEGTSIEIRGGVRPGERLVLEPPPTLADGDRVQVRE
jgi:RND family efflux transporter MFP subunit